MFKFFRHQNKSKLEITTDILFDQCYEKIYKTVYMLTRNKELTEDAVQEGLYKAMTKLDQLRDKSKFCSWATSIALNEAKSMLFKNNKQQSFTDIDYLLEKTASGMDPVYHVVSSRDQVKNILNQLNHNQREILILKYYLDFNLEEIAETLGISTDNAKVRLHRARQRYKAIDEANISPDEVAGGLNDE